LGRRGCGGLAGAMMEWGSAVPMGMANRLSREKVPGHLDGLYHHGDTGVFCGPRGGAGRGSESGIGTGLQRGRALRRV
jgi:hypothetical protein